MGGASGKFAGGLDTLTNDGSKRYALSEGGRVEPKQVGRVTPCAPFCPGISRRARSDAPYPPSLRHYENVCLSPPLPQQSNNKIHGQTGASNHRLPCQILGIYRNPFVPVHRLKINREFKMSRLFIDQHLNEWCFSPTDQSFLQGGDCL